MSRMVSFFVLLGILLAVGVLFFKVIAGFLLPLFMALLLVVMFRPLHRWFVQRLGGRRRLAAAATTAAVLVVFLGPLLLVFWEAASEAMVIYRRINSEKSPLTMQAPRADADDASTPVRRVGCGAINVPAPR